MPPADLANTLENRAAIYVRERGEVLTYIWVGVLALAGVLNLAWISWLGWQSAQLAISLM
jgi:hypothetical protein